MTVVFGTGHRPDKLGGYDVLSADKVEQVAIQALRLIRPDTVITGMALGWDTALAKAAIHCEIPFIAAVPFTGQESQWPPASQKIYNDILTKAQYVHIVSEGGYTPRKMQVRNVWMVDNGDVCLAMWDGSDGGTANCVRAAAAAGKLIINLHPAWRGDNLLRSDNDLL